MQGSLNIDYDLILDENFFFFVCAGLMNILFPYHKEFDWTKFVPLCVGRILLAMKKTDNVFIVWERC